MRIKSVRPLLTALGAAALLGTWGTGAAWAQLSVTPLNGTTATPQTLADIALSETGGVTITGVSYQGANVASGLFSGGAGILGFDTGIVLTSGFASNVIGPNNNPGATGRNDAAGSTLLNALLPTGQETEDASVLSITFIPTGNQVTFNYVFGSEEYNEFVNSPFNDVFGFFVNGVNYALLPGTNQPVTIDTVNLNTNSGLFRDNEPGGINTQLDGLTTVLTLNAPVIAGVENTLVLAIGDTGDDILDSAVFIQAGSFQVPPPPGNVIPEPGTLALLGTGALGLLGAVRRRRA